MPIVWRCPCGKKLKAPDDDAGKRVGCSRCRTAQTVPGAPASPPLPAAILLDEDDRPEPPRPAPRRSRPRPARRGGIPPAVLIGGLAVLLLGCLGLGGLAAYYVGFAGGTSGPSPEDELVGDWETDPEPAQAAADKDPRGVPLFLHVEFTFHKDHTYTSNLPFMEEGRWKVVGRDGKRLRVEITSKVFGIESDNPATPTITILDHDHMDFDANEASMQLQGRFRRVGSGPPPGQKPAAPAAPPEPLPKADGWESYTLDRAVTLELPAKPGKSRAVATPALGEMLRCTEFSVAGAGREIHVYLYRQPRPPAKAQRGRQVAEAIGVAVLADGPVLPVADRRYQQGGKPAFLFVRKEGRAAGIHLAVGDENLVCLVSIAGRVEEDAVARRLFGSVKFER